MPNRTAPNTTNSAAVTTAALIKRLESAAKRLVRPSDRRIVRSFPMFSPASYGSTDALAALTVQSVRRTFPLLLELAESVGVKLEQPVALTSLPDTGEKQQAARDLKGLFDRYGSDKSTDHSYHLLYGPLLASRNARAVLEVGLGTNDAGVVSYMPVGKPGASLRAFRDFLPQAEIYGADIDRSILFTEERISTFYVDQTDGETFKALGSAIPREFDLIIDDGLHSPDANLATLTFGLGRVKVGGNVVIEDIAPEAMPMWQVVSALLPDRYSSRVVSTDHELLFLVHRLA